ncbi:MAG TPA: aldehyde dehydrogenase family protein, partial [Acidimicrobiia bacterium]|nr:aldehyde dehydrogenase family protein [Acidimicrobiia bacterium]
MTPALVDGEPMEAADVIEVCSPWDGRLLGSVPACSARQVDQAVSVALDRHRGPQLPPHRRAVILDRVAGLL